MRRGWLETRTSDCLRVAPKTLKPAAVFSISMPGEGWRKGNEGRDMPASESKSTLRRPKLGARWHRIGLPRSIAGQAGRSVTKQRGGPRPQTVAVASFFGRGVHFHFALIRQQAPTESRARFAITSKRGCPKQVVTP